MEYAISVRNSQQNFAYSRKTRQVASHRSYASETRRFEAGTAVTGTRCDTSFSHEFAWYPGKILTRRNEWNAKRAPIERLPYVSRERLLSHVLSKLYFNTHQVFTLYFAIFLDSTMQTVVIQFTMWNVLRSKRKFNSIARETCTWMYGIILCSVRTHFMELESISKSGSCNVAW